MKIPSYLWIVLVLIMGIGFLIFAGSQRNQQSIISRTLPVDVEVFLDFNCTHCADFEPYVAKAKEQFSSKANIQLKMLPILTSGQEEDTSTIYALAAIAARKQNKINEYSEILFKWISYVRNPNNTLYSYSDEEKEIYSQPIDVVKVAEIVQLDMERFNQDRVSSDTNSILLAEKNSAIKRMGGASTPAVFFYGEYKRLTSYSDIITEIDKYITQVESLQASK